MHLIFLAARIFPFWAIPISIVTLQLGIHFWRRRRAFHVYCWIICVLLLSGVGAWLYFRGDVNSDRWVRALFFE